MPTACPTWPARGSWPRRASSRAGPNGIAKRSRCSGPPTSRRADRWLMVDAQTSGGLLFAVPADRAKAARAALEAAGTPAARIVGLAHRRTRHPGRAEPSQLMAALPVAIAHLDESCLGNGREGASPGGRRRPWWKRGSPGPLVRRDVFISSARHHQQPDGARRRHRRAAAHVREGEADSRAPGLRFGVPGPRHARMGAGMDLARAGPGRRARSKTWRSGRRWSPPPPTTRSSSPGSAVTTDIPRTSSPITSRCGPRGSRSPRMAWSNRASTRWLEKERARSRYSDYDPSAAYAELERRVAAGERFPLDAGTIP